MAHGGDKARHTARGGQIIAFEAAVPNRPLPDGGEHHIGQADITRKVEGAINFGRQIKPGQRLADQWPGARRAQGRKGGRIEQGRRCRQIPKAQALLAMGDKPVRRFTALPIHIPPVRRRHAQQRARQGRTFPHRRFEHPHRGGAAGQHGRCAIIEHHPPPAAKFRQSIRHTHARGDLASVFIQQQTVSIGATKRGRFHRHGPPIRAQFIRHQMRDHGIAALPQFRLWAEHGDMTIGADFEEGAKHLFPRRDVDGRRIDPRPKAPCQCQPRRRAATDEDGTPVHVWQRLTQPVLHGAKAGHAGPVIPRRAISTFGQRSITTFSPAASARSAAA